MTSFQLLPPELNSALMYAGAGSGPLFSAAAAWAGLAADLDASASSFNSVISGLANGSWTGPAAAAMAGIAASYVGWLNTSAGLAAVSGAQASAAASAFDAARTATVHPAEVELNRKQFMTLVATNFLGLNTPAIAATEFQYMEMWLQDVTAMVGYHAQAISVAAQLTPFALPAIDLAGFATQAAGLATEVGTAASVLGSQAATALAAFPLSTVSEGVQLLSTPLSMALTPLSSMPGMSGATPASAGFAAAEMPEARAAATPEALKPMGGSGLGPTGGLGQARMVGALSVPQGWAGSVLAGMGSSALSGLGSMGMPAAAAAANAEAAAGAGAGMPMMPMPTGAGAAGGMPGAMTGRGGGGPHVVQSRPSVIPRTGV